MNVTNRSEMKFLECSHHIWYTAKEGKILESTSDADAVGVAVYT